MTARRQRGTAVIMAMLIVAAVATLVSGALWRQSALMLETENERAYAQARWLIRGAIDWAGVILREDARTSTVDHAGEPWAVPLADTRLNENDGRPPAYLAGEIQDEQSKFNLRNLVALQIIVDARELQALRRLLEALSLESQHADAIARGMLAAVKSQRAHQPALGLASLEELLDVEGLDAADKVRLRPFVTVLPDVTLVNANTATAEVLASQILGLPLLDARRLVAGRERAYFRDAADLRARLTQAGVPPGNIPLALATGFFSVEGAVSYGRAQLRVRALLKRDGNRLETVWLQETG